MERQEPTKAENPEILIVCEGVNTEVSYFRQFKLATANVVTVGAGTGAPGVLAKTIELSGKKEYDYKACVFDKDEIQAGRFNEVVKEAASLGFITAWSNQAFEYWFILHMLDHQGQPMPRKDYTLKINEHLKDLGISYDGKKTKVVSDDLFEYFEAIDPKTGKPRIQLAIERAERNEKFHNGELPATSESCTCVHYLVKKLIEFR
ncbi:MAG: RloB family protein [Balneolales bacterium]|nr:RloB family protein [Balneolales bacterium]